ncbi:hypothetical protein BDV27DRAFT_30672 [Aspergillus caelatus]|uniref:Uncharacterized protein n=1 Tax=Aspergillus caelatus TaxID=61420 RepID=A0A5N6ZY93_9EURO|nr:uncharacterized protein BDV27DRAFT_30672 [Aspergillus caelatus]KAE8361260.1 hypothetical protein BDV27DRAFT_30672 [Aspergillus caelatus]
MYVGKQYQLGNRTAPPTYGQPCDHVINQKKNQAFSFLLQLASAELFSNLTRSFAAILPNATGCGYASPFVYTVHNRNHPLDPLGGDLFKQSRVGLPLSRDSHSRRAERSRVRVYDRLARLYCLVSLFMHQPYVLHATSEVDNGIYTQVT